MSDDLKDAGGRKALDARVTGWQCLLAYLIFVAGSYIVPDLPEGALWGVLTALIGKQGVHAYGNVQEHNAKAKVEVARTKEVEPKK